MNQNSTSSIKVKRSRPWLQAHYEARKKRTVDLVKASVDRLTREKQVVTIEAIKRRGRENDIDGGCNVLCLGCDGMSAAFGVKFQVSTGIGINPLQARLDLAWSSGTRFNFPEHKS